VANLVNNNLSGNVRTISQTEIGLLLDGKNTDFHEALLQALGNDDEKYRKLIDGKDLTGNRISSDSLWDDASRRFVANSSGKVRVLSTDGLVNSVFAETELPELLNNPNITEIDGIERVHFNALRDAKGMDAVREVIFNNSAMQVQLADLSNGNLQQYLDLEPGRNFDNYLELYKDPATRARVAQYHASIDPERLNNLRIINSSVIEAGETLVSEGLARGANKLGMFGAAAGFMLAAYSSSLADEAGEHERAKEIMLEWAADAAGSTAGEAVGAAVGGAAIAIAATAGATLTAPLSGAIIFGAALIGGIFGAEGATGIYELTKDQDGNGKIDLFDKLGSLLFGDSYTITDVALPGFEGRRITLDTRFTRGEIVENAKASIAWRYALEKLNPFVIEGDEDLYARHNQNGELDLENFSEQYLIDRAEMLLWRMRYDKEGKSYASEWNSWELSGDWDFIDQRILLNGQQPLKLAIDGWNGFPPTDTANHQVVFGSDDSDPLVGGENSDYLYGMAGDDSLDGKIGDDYLEGGHGFDSYFYNSGDGLDVIYDNDGSGVIIYNGNALDGGIRIGDGLYQGSIGQVSYKFDDSGNGTGTLLIDNRILIRGFDRNPDAFLGITLRDESAGDMVATETLIQGTAADDPPPLLDGGSGSDHILGLDGNDWLRGFNGADLLEGGAGNDILQGGLEADSLYGGKAEDIDQVIDSDQRPLGNSHDWLSGSAGNDRLFGSDGADVLFGGEGRDLVLGGAGSDFIQGDSERMPMDHSWVDIWLLNNELQASGVLNPLGSGDDTLLGGAGNDHIWGQAGNDLINGGSGNDLLSGDMVGVSAAGARLLSGEFHGNDVINGDAGDDILEGGGGSDMLFGGAGNDSLYGDAESVLMADGSDLVLPADYHGSDLLYGNEGDDLLVGGAESDTLEGGAGADSLYGDDQSSGLDFTSHGDDTLRGGADDDLLMGNGGDDRLYGDDGDDSAWGGAGNDYIAGGSGGDYLVGDDDSDSGENDGADILLGGAGDDTLYGAGGNDQLGGGAGIDLLYGGDGDDLIEGGPGSDFLRGGAGADTFLFNRGDGFDIVVGDNDDKVVLPAAAEVALALATASDGSDYLAITYGSGDWVFLEGGLETPVDQYDLGKQQIYDKRRLLSEKFASAIEYRMQDQGEISGGRYDDTLVGSYGDDIVHGQAGDDILAGGGGDDHLLGGAGSDIYRFGWGSGMDSISELPGEVNQLELFADARIEDLTFERAGNDLFIRLGVGGDGVRLSGYFLDDQHWRIIDQFDEMLLNRENQPPLSDPLVADSPAIAWQQFNRGIEAAYAGLLRLHGFDEVTGGVFERSYSGGEINNRWKNSYSVTLATQLLDEVSGSYRRLLPDLQSDIFDQREQVSVPEQLYLGGSASSYLSAGRSGANYVSLDGSASGTALQPGDQLVPDYGLNIWRNPLTGTLEREILGYFVYPIDTVLPESTPIYRSYTETDYQVKVNIARIEAGDGNDQIVTGATRFNLVDGGGGDDLIDASATDASIPLPGQNSVISSGMPGSLLFGNTGDDALYGGALDDLLIGGSGRDSLTGGDGNDSYLLFDTNGGDRIFEWGRERAVGIDDDLLVLPAGIGFNDLSYHWGESVEKDDLIESWRYGRQIHIPVESMHATFNLAWPGSEGVSIVLPHSDKAAGFGIDRVKTTTGESRSLVELMAEAGPGPEQDLHQQNNSFSGKGLLNGAGGDDWLIAEPNNYYPYRRVGVSVLIGGAGRDFLQGGDGYNILIGGQPVLLGRDGLSYNHHFIGDFWGDPGNTFSGGKGYDELWTTAGKDTILFGLGDGTDVVSNLYSADPSVTPPTGLDVLKFGAGITPGDISVSVEQEGDYEGSLLFAHENGEDRIYFRNWLGSDFNQLNQVEFDDGAVWDWEMIQALALGEQNGNPPQLQVPLTDVARIVAIPFSIAIPQTTFSHGSGSISYSVELEDGSPLPEWLDFDAANGLLYGTPTNDQAGVWSIKVIASIGSNLTASDVFELTLSPVEGVILNGGEQDDRLIGTALGDVIIGGTGSDRLYGVNGDDSLVGGAGADRLYGGRGSDDLSGGVGNDKLKGGRGNDRLVGDEGDDKLFGGKGDDAIFGSSGDDMIRGGAGNDRILAGTGGDHVIGGEGEDVLHGEAGDDYLDGGADADYLYAGDGNDKLFFDRNYGHDKVMVGQSSPGELDLFEDQILFGSGILPEQLWFRARDYHLDVSIIGTEDKLTIERWYDNDASKADAFIISDGSQLLRENVQQLVSAMAGFDPPVMGETFLPEDLRVPLESIIAASWQ